MKILPTHKYLEIADVFRLLKAAQHEELVLVGGQAVLLYAHLYDFGGIATGVSGDMDLLGQVQAARSYREKLGLPSSFKEATLDDNTINTALIAVSLNSHENPVVIDFVRNLGGLDEKEVLEKALSISLQGSEIQVIHPFHLLQSKLYNVVHIPSKRSENSQFQMKLSLGIAHRYLKEFLLDESTSSRSKLKAIENFFKIISSDNAIKADGLSGPLNLPEIMKSVTLDIGSFNEKRLPQMIQFIEKKQRDLESFKKWQAINGNKKPHLVGPQ